MRPEPTQTIEGDAFFFDVEGADHFGHITLELMSRLWCVDEVNLRRLKFITSSQSQLINILLRPFGIDEDQIIRFNRPILVKSLMIANQAFILDRVVSENAFLVWDRIASYYRHLSGPKRIYVSRANWLKQRVLRNERDVEELFRDYGFTVIYPEAIPLPEQISLFANAAFIAGPSGSSLYNCVFSCGGHRLILVSKVFIKRNDALINAKSKAKITYVAGAPEGDEAMHPMLRDWGIDLSFVKNQLQETLDNC